VKLPLNFYFSALPKFRLKFSRWACFLVLSIACPLLRASDLPSPYTFDLPFQANQATPIWLGHPETPHHAFATLDLPIIPPDPDASLLVTVYFQEKEGGFLRISWQQSGAAQMLSDNFYEGIGMNNQRTLLITPETLQGEGTLHFQCDGTALGIHRIRLEWLENRASLVSPLLQDLLVTPSMGLTQPSPALSGQPRQTDEAVWHNQIVTVPITELPERIEQGVEFSVQLDHAPGSARLALKETGLPWGQHIVVWINQKRAGTISPAVPDLLDDGFLALANSPGGYVGWRDGSFYVPVALLKTGVNAVQFSAENDALSENENSSYASTGSLSPMAIKDVVLQLNYPPPPQPPAPSTPSTTPQADSPTPVASSTDSSVPSPLSP